MCDTAVVMALGGAIMFGCGASSLDNCEARCDALKRCAAITESGLLECRADCDADAATLANQDQDDDSRCKNAGDVRSQIRGCYHSECSAIDRCLAELDTMCQFR